MLFSRLPFSFHPELFNLTLCRTQPHRLILIPALSFVPSLGEWHPFSCSNQNPGRHLLLPTRITMSLPYELLHSKEWKEVLIVISLAQLGLFWTNQNVQPLFFISPLPSFEDQSINQLTSAVNSISLRTWAPIFVAIMSCLDYCDNSWTHFPAHSLASFQSTFHQTEGSF